MKVITVVSYNKFSKPRPGYASFRLHHHKVQKCRNAKTRSLAVARIADRTASQQTRTFRENYLRACSGFPIQSRVPNLKSLAEVVLEMCLIVCQKL